MPRPTPPHGARACAARWRVRCTRACPLGCQPQSRRNTVGRHHGLPVCDDWTACRSLFASSSQRQPAWLMVGLALVARPKSPSTTIGWLLGPGPAGRTAKSACRVSSAGPRVRLDCTEKRSEKVRRQGRVSLFETMRRNKTQGSPKTRSNPTQNRHGLEVMTPVVHTGCAGSNPAGDSALSFFEWNKYKIK